MAVSLEMRTAVNCHKPTLHGRLAHRSRRYSCVVSVSYHNVEETSRRSALSLLTGALVLTRAQPSLAAYGEAANVFGKSANAAGFVPYAGDGFAVLIPSKWNPSKERDFPGIQLRYEDNADSISNVTVLVSQADKSSIAEFGTPDSFLPQLKFLLGAQTFTGATRSEGGFDAGKVATAALLDVQEANDKAGRQYYKYEIFTRTADGDEGGRHYLLTATVSGGNLYILKVQIGDKRWFKGADRTAKGIWNSFVVA